LKIAYAELEERLDREVEPVYLLVGDQDLLREIAAKKLQKAVVGENPSPFSFERFDGESESKDASRILIAANTMPLLGGRRLVLVKRASALLEGDSSLAAYLESPNPAAVLVLDLEKKPDARRKGTKDLEKKVAIVACDAPQPWELEDWVAEEGRARGLKLGREEIRYLVTETGSDLHRLSNELEKLSLYASGDRLDLETVAEVLGRGRAQSVFNFIDAVARGDGGSALRQLGRLLEEGGAFRVPRSWTAWWAIHRETFKRREAGRPAGLLGRRLRPGHADAPGLIRVLTSGPALAIPIGSSRPRGPVME
jgi:DNA polymerase-3 subunit delta